MVNSNVPAPPQTQTNGGNGATRSTSQQQAQVNGNGAHVESDMQLPQYSQRMTNGYSRKPSSSSSLLSDPEKGENTTIMPDRQSTSPLLSNGHALHPHKRMSRTPSSSSASAAISSEWNDLVDRLSNVSKQWKKVYEREGWQGLQRAFATTASQTASFLVHRFNRLQRRRKYTLIATAALILMILMFDTKSPATVASRSKSNSALSILASDGTEAAKVDRQTGKFKSANKAKVLESFSNPYGFISLIDPYAGGVFNPSVLVLPDTLGAGWKHLLVARGPEKYEVIDGADTRWEQLVGCFLLPMTRQYLNLPYLARESELEVLKLPADRLVDYQRCENPTFDQFIGAEDPRLFLTNDGQPLLIYSQTGRSPMICRAIYIIDARMVIPGLTEALKKGGWNPPLIFKNQTDLIRSDQSNIEKNWSPFLGERDELYFHVSLVPQRIYKYVDGLTLRPIDQHTPTHNCLTDVIGAEMNRVHFHHATPLLRVTLCRRGECKPTIHNTVLFGIIHIKYHPLPYLYYERRVITLNVTSPYEYLSVSKPLTYSGTNQADPIFTVSMSWDHPTTKHGLGLNHGFLDDVVMTSFGVGDYGSAYIDVLARDMLTDHTLCSGVRGATMAWS